MKYLDDYEADRAAAAQLNGERYQRILSNEYAWNSWAVPKTADGKFASEGSVSSALLDNTATKDGKK